MGSCCASEVQEERTEIPRVEQNPIQESRNTVTNDDKRSPLFSNNPPAETLKGEDSTETSHLLNAKQPKSSVRSAPQGRSNSSTRNTLSVPGRSPVKRKVSRPSLGPIQPGTPPPTAPPRRTSSKLKIQITPSKKPKSPEKEKDIEDIDEEMAKIDEELMKEEEESRQNAELESQNAELESIDRELRELEEEEEVNAELKAIEAEEALLNEELRKEKEEALANEPRIEGESDIDRKERIARNFRKRARALWDFDGDVDNDELSFKTGDIIYVIEEDDEGWWHGELDGKDGWFPVNYVEIMKRDVKVATQTIDPKIKLMQQVLKI